MKTTNALRKAWKTLLLNFRCRWGTIYNKLCELHEDYNVEVYLIVRREGKFYSFAASDDPHFPPPLSEIVG